MAHVISFRGGQCPGHYTPGVYKQDRAARGQAARRGRWRRPDAVADRTVGLLLSCNVVVRAAGDCTIVEALDPRAIADIAGQPLLKDVAQDAAARLRAALDTLPPER